jgi:hypothetical protein
MLRALACGLRTLPLAVAGILVKRDEGRLLVQLAPELANESTVERVRERHEKEERRIKAHQPQPFALSAP